MEKILVLKNSPFQTAVEELTELRRTNPEPPIQRTDDAVSADGKRTRPGGYFSARNYESAKAWQKHSEHMRTLDEELYGAHAEVVASLEPEMTKPNMPVTLVAVGDQRTVDIFTSHGFAELEGLLRKLEQ